MFKTLFIIGLVFVALLLAARILRGRPADTGAPRLWDRLVYTLLIACTLILAITGIGRGLTSDEPMTGWGLMIHCTVAPPFAVMLAVAAVTFAERSRFAVVEKMLGWTFLQKALFWLMLVFGLVSILSAVVPMTPLLGQHNQELMYDTHRYGSLLFFIFLLAHATWVFARRRRAKSPVPTQGVPQPV